MDIIEHTITLKGKKVVLRPITEYDWDMIWHWNYNPDALFFSEGRNLIKSSPGQIQEVYRHISKEAFGFIIDVNNRPIGDCWFQKVNVERILRDHPVKHCRCIDLLMGDVEFFKGRFDVDVIRTLTKFGFEKEKADMMFGCDIFDYNKQSLKAFQKVGYQIYDKVKQPPGSKSKYLYDVFLSREWYKS